jgi:hypothetical protein
VAGTIPRRERRTPANLAATLGDAADYELNAEPGSYLITGAPAGLVPFVTVVYAAVTADGWHLAADHHDLVAYGTELLVVVAFIFVGARLVARRLFG